MCITSIVPEVDYSAEGLNKFNAKFDRGDYYHPEFQDLGLQPVFGYELKNHWISKVPSLVYSNYADVQNKRQGNYILMENTEVVHRRNSVLGFVPRYSEYKVSFDRLHGEFRNGRSLSAWSGSNMLDYDRSGVLINTLKIDARCLNRIFSVQYDGRESNDQFMCAAQFVTKAIRPMSITGQSI